MTETRINTQTLPTWENRHLINRTPKDPFKKRFIRNLKRVSLNILEVMAKSLEWIPEVFIFWPIEGYLMLRRWIKKHKKLNNGTKETSGSDQEMGTSE